MGLSILTKNKLKNCKVCKNKFRNMSSKAMFCGNFDNLDP